MNTRTGSSQKATHSCWGLNLRAWCNCQMSLYRSSMLAWGCCIIWRIQMQTWGTKSSSSRGSSWLNNREVQNYVRRRKPPTYAKALHITNKETSFVLMDLANACPRWTSGPVPGDTSFIATLKGWRTDAGKSPNSCCKCYYCDKEGHFKERCLTRLKDFLKQRANKGNRRTSRPQTAASSRTSRTASPAAWKKQVKFVEASQTLPVVAESYGKKEDRRHGGWGWPCGPPGEARPPCRRRSPHLGLGNRGRSVQRASSPGLARRWSGFSGRAADQRVRPYCPFSHRTTWKFNKTNSFYSILHTFKAALSCFVLCCSDDDQTDSSRGDQSSAQPGTGLQCLRARQVGEPNHSGLHWQRQTPSLMSSPLRRWPRWESPSPSWNQYISFP